MAELPALPTLSVSPANVCAVVPVALPITLSVAPVIVRALVLLSTLAGLVTLKSKDKVPAPTVVAPVYVLALVRTKVPVPVLVRPPPAPLRMPLNLPSMAAAPSST